MEQEVSARWRPDGAVIPEEAARDAETAWGVALAS
jgi:hypothetical protein